MFRLHYFSSTVTSLMFLMIVSTESSLAVPLHIFVLVVAPLEDSLVEFVKPFTIMTFDDPGVVVSVRVSVGGEFSGRPPNIVLPTRTLVLPTSICKMMGYFRY